MYVALYFNIYYNILYYTSGKYHIENIDPRRVFIINNTLVFLKLC